MSYLVDALRKAERERNVGQVPDLAAATHYASESTRSAVPWTPIILIILVLLNLSALLVFWFWGSGTQQSAEGTQSSQSAPAVAAQAATPAQTQASTQSQASAPRPEMAPSRPAQRPQAEPPANNAPARGPRAQQSYRQPATAVQQEPEPEAQAVDALPNDQRVQLPNMAMNGHLYSSVPGRSFIIVNGRRYHEGQRIAEGPAIEAIEPAAAVFRYRDIRFRLDAPR